ncbi:Type II/IV secretion system ATP hydrolase TadA/VirB11/CpaF, TadA subfamily [Labilithrix luteola]|uniref:Type II/IV secretion system ATP hydrolase TadA/VirB11/CpaF, TadA subfamily n=1 Tax=Labilithrix luteola TaxID=1391654 RepID=A0A0K1QD52_9BACT|nr:ATPase, T2SS/T4P/T4SS family [Labilithrix luteola]AKV03658.1 Type II/IV secretion system ATP hydrolase TadA/VirB11/CpaF, TadA subfamily [Labilithrix luteola]
MFSIIISEKGGAERRESFDKNEINVGRVQGNDLMLPKGNVSKHHARLLFRDGRFIVTDLKSTNGTYVNGRKIAQATIVREGDKIYIGDFVLRLDANGAGGAAVPTASSDEESIRTLGRENANGNVAASPNVPPAPAPARAPGPPPPPAVTLKAPTHPPGAPLPKPQPQNVSNVPTGQLNAYPLEQDPDDSAPIQVPKPRPSAPPPAPSMAGRPMTMPLNQMSPPPLGPRLQQPATAPPMLPIQPAAAPPLPVPAAAPPPPAPAPAPLPPPPAASAPAVAPPPPPPPAPAPVAAPPPPQPSAPQVTGSGPAVVSAPARRPTAPPPRMPAKEPPAQAARRLAMTMLLGRIADTVDLAPLRGAPTVSEVLASQIERAARDQATAMRNEGEAPQDVDLEQVVRDAHRELVGLGALGPLLDDDEVQEIHCVRFDQIFTLRGDSVVSEGFSFSSEDALHRAVLRLAAQGGEALAAGQTIIERRLARASLVAVVPPSSTNLVATVRKRTRIETSFDELVRNGSLSKPMAQFLEACVAARSNVLVSGDAAPLLLTALATAGTPGERVAVVQDAEEIVVGNAHLVTLSPADSLADGEACVRAASRLHPDRLVVTRLAGGVAAATVEVTAEGVDGVYAGMHAATLRQALSRLVAQLVLHRPGLTLEGMRDVVADAFDIAIEVSTLPDGRVRVMRIAELGSEAAKGLVSRDLFVFTPDATDGTFSATGVVPRLANELAARGTKLDPALFKKVR